MFKKSKRLIGLCLGVVLSLGVGVGLGSTHGEAVGVKAADTTVKWTVSSKTDLGDSNNKQKTGTIKTGEYEWTFTRDGKYYATGLQTQSNKNYIQVGSNGNAENLEFKTSNIPGTIKSVSVDCSSYNNAHKVAITVAGNTYLAASATAKWTTVSVKTGTGTSSGEIIISFIAGSSARALYINSISVTFEEAAAKPESIAISDNSGKTWYDGDTITTADLKVIPTYVTGDGDPITDGTDVFFDEGKTLTKKVLSEGENVITVWYNSTSGSLTITALAPRVLQNISVSGYKDSFSQGDDFEFGGKVTATYSVGDDVDVTSEASFTGYDLSTVGTQTVTVSYGEKTTSYEIVVTKSMKVIFDATADYPGENESTTELTKNNITIEIGSGTLANKSEYRVYQNYSLTISVSQESELKISKIDLIAGADGTTKYGPGCFELSSGGGAYSYESKGKNGTWEYAEGSRKITLLASSAQVRITKLTVTLMDYTFKTEAKEYAVYFNEFIGCDPAGAVEPDGWADLKEMWSDLSNGAQTYLKNADSSTETNADIINCITTYEYIVNKYNSKDSTTYNDFMARGIVPANASNLIYRSSGNNTAILIVILVAFTSITAIGGYFFIRRRNFN